MRKQQRGFGVIEIVIALVVIAIVGLLGWVLWSKLHQSNGDDQPKTSVSVNEKPTKSGDPTPSEITEKIRASFADNYKLLNIDENNQPKEGELSIRLGKGSPIYQVPGFSFYTTYDGGSTLDLMPYSPDLDQDLPGAANTKLRKDVAAIYKSFGLSQTGTLGDGSAEQEVYTGKGLICTIEAPTAQTSSNAASCGLVDSYKAAAEKVKPIADALPDVTGTVLSGLKIEDGANGYQRASVAQGMVNFGGAVALLYKKDTADKWTYFRHTQNALPCEVFNTDASKNAFKGETCYDAAGQKSNV